MRRRRLCVSQPLSLTETRGSRSTQGLPLSAATCSMSPVHLPDTAHYAHHSTLHSTPLHSTPSHSAALHCTALHCTADLCLAYPPLMRALTCPPLLLRRIPTRIPTPPWILFKRLHPNVSQEPPIQAWHERWPPLVWAPPRKWQGAHCRLHRHGCSAVATGCRKMSCEAPPFGKQASPAAFSGWGVGGRHTARRRWAHAVETWLGNVRGGLGCVSWPKLSFVSPASGSFPSVVVPFAEFALFRGQMRLDSGSTQHLPVCSRVDPRAARKHFLRVP